MEKIKLDELLGFTQDGYIKRLKTLEEDNAIQKKMIKFIMKNTPTALHPSHKPEFSLQDLWDENFKPDTETAFKAAQELEGYNILSPRELEILDKTFGKPTVKEYPCKCDCHNKMTKEELYPDNKPIANCGLCCLDESTVKECDCDCHNNIAHHIDERCKCMPYNKSEKIEEELGTLITGDYAYGHKMSEEEWDKFNKMRKDKKIEEIISELNYRFLDRYRGIIFPNGYRPYDYLQHIESWLRDKLKSL